MTDSELQDLLGEICNETLENYHPSDKVKDLNDRERELLQLFLRESFAVNQAFLLALLSRIFSHKP